jgi:hypothetical protein
MSEGIWICKSGLRTTKWDSNVREYVDKEINHPYHELRTACHIEPDVTLRDIINLVGSSQLLKELISEYSWCDVDAFVKEVNRPTTKKTDMDSIILYKYIDIGREVGEYIHVNGTGPNANKSEYDDRDYVDNWAIEFTPVNQMADLPVRLHPKAKILKDHKEEGESDCYFTFLDVIGEIFFEISFCGSPEDRDEKSAELNQVVEDIKSGKAKTKPWKDLQKLLPKETIN